MTNLFPIIPPSASTIARSVDMVWWIEIAMSVCVMLLVGGLILTFSIKYRRRTPHDNPPRLATNYALEIFWTTATFILFCGCFFLGAGLYVHIETPPKHAEHVYVVGKQWMWKIQHADGIREIDQLHVPIGRPIELIMTSEDVIHDFYVPAFRVKQDVIPGTYTTEWFTATRPGTYHLFCSQYCGTNHAAMVGTVTVLTDADYDKWRAGMSPATSTSQAGRALFATYGCIQCHGQTAPTLAGLYGRKVELNDGSTVVADEGYLRESIVDPGVKVVAGYAPIMPSFEGQLTAEQINTMVQYIENLKGAKSSTTKPAKIGPLMRQLQDIPPAQGRPSVEPALTPEAITR